MDYLYSDKNYSALIEYSQQYTRKKVIKNFDSEDTLKLALNAKTDDEKNFFMVYPKPCFKAYISSFNNLFTTAGFALP